MERKMCQHVQDLEFEDVAQVCNEIAHIQKNAVGIYSKYDLM